MLYTHTHTYARLLFNRRQTGSGLWRLKCTFRTTGTANARLAHTGRLQCDRTGHVGHLGPAGLRAKHCHPCPTSVAGTQHPLQSTRPPNPARCGTGGHPPARTRARTATAAAWVQAEAGRRRTQRGAQHERRRQRQRQRQNHRWRRCRPWRRGPRRQSWRCECQLSGQQPRRGGLFCASSANPESAPCCTCRRGCSWQTAGTSRPHRPPQGSRGKTA